jgi:gluconate 2-dehydrogenase gamma chain
VPVVSTAALIRDRVPWSEGRADAPAAAASDAGTGSAPPAYQTLTRPEADFVEAAIARLIPNDELGPGALEAGVAVFIDRQLGGPYGRAEHWYMQGPWGEGESTQGWQSRLTPLQMYRTAVREIDAAVAKEGRAQTFARLPADAKDEWLHRLEDGKVELAGVDAKAFFKMLMQNTEEGFWADPIYGGNRDMVGWKLIGFAGARYDQLRFVDRHGERYPLPPVSLAGRPAWHDEKKG